MRILVFFIGFLQIAYAETFVVGDTVTVRTFKNGQNYLSQVGELTIGSHVTLGEESGPERYRSSSGRIVRSGKGWYKGVKVIHDVDAQTEWNIDQVYYISLSHQEDLYAVGTPASDRRIPLRKMSRPQDLGEKHRLWGTYYYTPQYKVGGDYVLHDMEDNELMVGDEPAALSLKQFCFAGMEGSVRILFSDNRAQTFNYDGVIEPALADCSPFFGDRFTGTPKVRYRKAFSSWGDGVEPEEEKPPFSLIPYRSIAVNPEKIPYGTVLYVPKAVGTRIKLPNGRYFTHDGYFLAADTGGAMRRDATHIDFFVGNSQKRTFSFITSDENGLFDAFVVNDVLPNRHLMAIHKMIFGEPPTR